MNKEENLQVILEVLLSYLLIDQSGQEEAGGEAKAKLDIERGAHP